MLSKKLKGGALYIALIISIVIGITLSMFILIGFYNQKQVLSQISLDQLHHNLASAFNIAQSEYFPEYENNRWVQIGTNADSIRIKKLQWGAYTIISTETKNLHQYKSKCGLYGVLASSDTAIVVTDQNYRIGLTGKILLNGNCYFPKAGIKPVFIEGQSFNTVSPIYSLLRPAPNALPQIKNNFINGVKNSIAKFNINTDSLVSTLPEKINNNFSRKTIVFQSGSIHLNMCQLTGNIKIVGSNEVVIENTAALSNILIIAPNVTVKKGFKGALQIIASGSIIVEEECFLNYPSSLTVLNQKKDNSASNGIFVGGKSTIYGTLICLNDKIANAQNFSHVMLKLDKDCETYGIVYSSDYAHLQGKIFGTAFCDKLFITTPSAVYENHMMDCQIDPKKYAHNMIVPGIFKGKSINQCCLWL